MTSKYNKDGTLKTPIGVSKYMCPIPDCGHIGDFITIVHCRNEHNLERDKVFELYGMPKPVKYDYEKALKISRAKRELDKKMRGGRG